ncbi:hypothetical protein MKY14_21465 [Paenibacillus sp. FSL R5-0887]|uniref:hypothetical protein n=1 Tax=Paenibacillus sp. FSL R5-0887 TaxID=2921662 RepID=UPI0030FA1E86
MASLSQVVDWARWYNTDPRRIDELLQNPHRVPIEFPPGTRPISFIVATPSEVLACKNQWSLAIITVPPAGGNKAVAMMTGSLNNPGKTLTYASIVLPESPTDEAVGWFPLSNIIFLNPCP